MATPDIYFTRYSINATLAAITGYNVAGGLDVVIPEMLNNRTVYFIETNAFVSKGLTSVVFPSGLVAIYSGAFAGNNLETVVIPDNIAYLYCPDGNGCFANSHIVNLTIGTGVPIIYSNCFTGNNFNNLVIPSNIVTIESQGFYNSSISGLTLNEGLVTLGYRAFANNEIGILTLPNSLINFGIDCFYNAGLTSIQFSSTITTIPAAFKNNSTLTALKIPLQVTSIASAAFQNCPIVKIQIPGNLTSFTTPITYTFGSNLGFLTAYYNANKAEGTYEYINGSWSRTGDYESVPLIYSLFNNGFIVGLTLTHGFNISTRSPASNGPFNDGEYADFNRGLITGFALNPSLIVAYDYFLHLSLSSIYADRSTTIAYLEYDTIGDSYIYQDANRNVEIEIVLEQSGSDYLIKYKNENESYPVNYVSEKIYFTNDIKMQVYVEGRIDSTDLSGSNVTIINTSDKEFIIDIYNEDSTPRFNIVSQTGLITINYV